MTNKKIIFLYPSTNNKTEEGEKDNFILGKMSSLELSIAYLSNYLAKKFEGIEIEYIDLRLEPKSYGIETILDELSRKKYDYVAITCYSRNYLKVIEISSLIKKYNDKIKVIVGGFHPTIFPDDFRKFPKLFDYIIRGEGEIPLYNVVAGKFDNQKKPIIIRAPKKTKLNEFSPIDLNIFNKYENKIDFSDIPIYISRGCIFNCSFCISRRKTCGLKKYRSLELDNILKQLEILKKYNPKRVVITDPLFGVDKKWFQSVVKMIGRETKDFRVKVEMHVDIINQNKIEHLLANNIDLTIGFESASPSMLYLMNKTNDPARYIENAKHIIKKYGNSNQELMINILLGHPGESRNTITESFDFLTKNIKTGSVLTKFSLFRLYPGTPVYYYSNFFEFFFKTRFYLKKWWEHDLDYGIVPSLIDPSANLSIMDELSFIRLKIQDFIEKSVVYKENMPIGYKLFFLKYTNKIRKTYQYLIPKFNNCLKRISSHAEAGI